MGEPNLRTMPSGDDDLALELAPLGVLGHVATSGSAAVPASSWSHPKPAGVTRSFVASVVGWRPDVEPNAID